MPVLQICVLQKFVLWNKREKLKRPNFLFTLALRLFLLLFLKTIFFCLFRVKYDNDDMNLFDESVGGEKV